MDTKEFWMNLLFFLVVFLLFFVLTYCMNMYKFKKKKKKKIGELNYLVLKFRLDIKILPVRKMLLWFSFIDSFILSFVTTFISLLDISMLWRMTVGFVLLFALIYAFYEIYGRHLVNKGYGIKKGMKKNEL